MTNLDSILKNRHHFANEGPCNQSYGFSSSHGCEIWTIKNAECQILMPSNSDAGEDY